MSQPDSSHGSDENNGRKKREHITPAAPWHSKYTAEAKKVGASGWMKCMKKGRCRKAGDCVQRSGKGYRETKCRYCSWIFHICTATPKHREGAETGTRCRDGSRYCADGNYCDMSHPRKDKAGKVYGKCVSGERPTDHTEIPYEDQTVEYGQPLNVGLARDKADTGTRRPPLQYSNNDKIGDHYNEGKRKGSYAALARVEDVDALESGEGDLLLADGKGGGPGNRRAVARKEINLFQDGVVAVPAKELETLILDSVRRVGKSGKVYRPMQGYASKIRKALGKRIPHGRYRMVIIDDVNTWDSNLRMPDGNGAVNNIEPFQPGGRVKVEGENSKVYKLFQARLNRPPSNKVRPSKKLKDIIIDFQYD
ncbi:hypothetical protein DdX_14767 [Ditylenchus destructor]|uniref:Uncharacterized protein n=1 Tax=Ditylenchus destructor TaxID=166010 RepID=A0AAD4QVB5_9BILA|nr:hypothetical protein DdX_14767 [Ditylenchus destructor]